MKLRISRKIVAKTALIICILLECGLFYFPFIPYSIQNINTYQKKTLMALVIIILGIVMLLMQRFKIKKTYFSSTVIVYFLLLTCEIIYSLVAYKQSISSLIHIILPYFCIFLYSIIKYIYLDSCLSEGNDYIVKIIIVFSSILATVLVGAAFLYNTSGEFILKIIDYDFSNYIPLRNDRLRLFTGNVIIPLSMLLSYSTMVRKGIKDKICVYNFLIGWIYLIYLAQTRALSLVVLLSCVASLILASSIAKWKKTIIILILAIGGVIVGQDIIPVFSVDSNEISVVYRLSSIDHFVSIFTSKPLTGNGFINEYINTEYFTLVHGSTGTSYYSDVGIIGTLAKFGVLMGCWYVYILVRICKLYIRNKNFNTLVLSIFSISCCITLSFLDPQRIILFPLIMSIAESDSFEYDICRKYDTEKNNEDMKSEKKYGN